jgi:hypothetical protein
MNVLSTHKKLQVISSLIEGNSVRSTERMTGVHRDTICRLLVSVGQNCAGLLDSHLRDLRCERIQCDEIWCFVGKKKRHVTDTDPAEFGDQWVFVAMDADTLGGHCKTGHSGSLENRPTELIRTELFYSTA